DITSTGETLRANHLKILNCEPVHKSQATLFKSRTAAWSDDTRATMVALKEMLGMGD
ncbi:MAG: ATP phosphoribosyltransferase catalytic subunit HisG, partial [Alphaproteobacteria bacterium]|nr:ATP phosphoribosyltransferase catalytic subunit HisG [Alphaproteobacteria bacterium]MBU1572054.1 ATP phosphoribosyltransferase catalytic subunit HisG [Alphaproteobacteria bacterium]